MLTLGKQKKKINMSRYKTLDIKTCQYSTGCVLKRKQELPNCTLLVAFLKL